MADLDDCTGFEVMRLFRLDRTYIKLKIISDFKLFLLLLEASNESGPPAHRYSKTSRSRGPSLSSNYSIGENSGPTENDPGERTMRAKRIHSAVLRRGPRELRYRSCIGF